jgi:hypothetical protein
MLFTGAAVGASGGGGGAAGGAPGTSAGTGGNDTTELFPAAGNADGSGPTDSEPGTKVGETPGGGPNPPGQSVQPGNPNQPDPSKEVASVPEPSAFLLASFGVAAYVIREHWLSRRA